MNNTVTVTLNELSDNHTVVDSHTIEVTEQDASDIIDRAATLILLLEDGKNIGDASSELKESLMMAGVL